MAGQDIAVRPSAELDWSREKRESSLDVLFEQASDKANDAINWYLFKKKNKRRSAMALRVSAILAVTIAGLVPVLTQIPLIQDISPGWSTIFLGLAGAALALDKFFGFSSAWIRYIVAELDIREKLQEFQMDWQMQRATWIGEAPTDEQAAALMQRVKQFVEDVDGIVKTETQVWVAEFKSALKELDDRAKAKALEMKPGAVKVKVPAGADFEEPGWTVSIDRKAGAGPYPGTSAVIRPVLPGIHVVRVTGSRGGKPVHMEEAVTVTAGGVDEVEMKDE